jgi:hypothetical protein
MRKERRTLTGAFKAKVALEAIQERKTISQLAAEYWLQGNQSQTEFLNLNFLLQAPFNQYQIHNIMVISLQM